MLDRESYILSKLPGGKANRDGNLTTTCPFHGGTGINFSINVESGLFICYSANCGIRGNFALFYKMSEGINNWKQVYDAIKKSSPTTDLDELFGIKKKKEETKSYLVPFPIIPFIENIQSVKYLEDRGIGQDIIQYYELWYGISGEFNKVDISKSIVFPIYDVDGSYRSWQARSLSDNNNKSQRWISPRGNPNHNLLYGSWKIKDDDSYFWVVEGASDVWNLRKFGIPSVALFTKSCSPIQLEKIAYLSRSFNATPIVCMDGDARPKDIFSNKTDYNKLLYNKLIASGIDSLKIDLNYDEDPGSLTKERIRELMEGTEHGNKLYDK